MTAVALIGSMGILALAPSVEGKTTIRNDVSSSINTGGNTVSGKDGADGRDGNSPAGGGEDTQRSVRGQDGKDGEDGRVVEGNSKSSVSITTIIDGEVVESYEKTVENGAVSERRVHEIDDARVETRIDMSAEGEGSGPSRTMRDETASDAASDLPPSTDENITSTSLSSNESTTNTGTTTTGASEARGVFAAIQSFVSSVVAYVLSIFS